MSRREFLALAAAMSAAAGWAGQKPAQSQTRWQEKRDSFPEGVASGDPDAHSVLLWTRRPFADGLQAQLQLEVSEDEGFSRVVAVASAHVSRASDWTTRVLVGNLKSNWVYWYRFTDATGSGSRVGRTRTAPSDSDSRPVRFAFVSCQNVNLGTQNAYRRMIFEDQRRPPSDQLGFVLHLGDFIYDIVWYPEDRLTPIWGRMPRDTVRYPEGEKIGDMHIPATLEDYRAIYRTYLRDPDIQDARARWPFVPIWDNHEFSASGWQSFQSFHGNMRPAQTRKVAANQAWFEFQPARIRKSSGPSLDTFDPPQVHDAPIDRFDEHGLGQEPNNLAALNSLTGYRAMRWGRHVELMITDQRSYRSIRAGAGSDAGAKPLWSDDFPKCIAQEALEILDAGSEYANGKPPLTITHGSVEIPNYRRQEPPQTILGYEQKEWFKKRLQSSTATWKIWGNTTGTLDRRVDLQNLPAGLTKPWPGAGYATYEDGDHASAWVERAEIYSVVREKGITGFVTVAGDRHSFWAGLAASALPPKEFDPVGVAFITAAISMSSSADMLAAGLPHDHPLRSLFFWQRPRDPEPQPTVNMLLRHGVRSCLEYARTGDAAGARRLSNPELAPQLKFLDLGAHGFATVCASREALECEFVCIQKPIEHAPGPDGGPVLYRVVHRTPLWGKGQSPRLEQSIVEGAPVLSL